MDYLALIAQIAGSVTGAAMGSMDKQQAMALLQQSVDEYGKINVPKLQQLVLQQQGKTQLAGIKDDPRYRDQQNAADAQLSDVIDSGGLTLSDKAALNAIRNRTAQTESAGRNAITSSMAARGTLGAGDVEAEQLQGNQQSANTLAAADEATAGQAQARAYQAIRDRATLAGQGLDRSYREQSDAAKAQDAINAGNVAIQNLAAKYNAAIPQQDYENQLQLAKEKLNPLQAEAGLKAANAKDTQQMWTGIGNMGANALKNSGSSGGSSGGYSNTNLPDSKTVDNSFNNADSSPAGGTDWSSYPGDSSALTGASTRPTTSTDGRPIIGYNADGTPIYGQPQGSNF